MSQENPIDTGVPETLGAVAPEEVEAILALAGEESRSPGVSERDFRHLRRMSGARLSELRRLAQGALPAIEAELAISSPILPELELALVEETTATCVLSPPHPSNAVVRFDIDGQSGWIAWRTAPAIACIEQVLGADSDDESDRPMTRVERGLLCQILKTIASPLCNAMGVSADGFRALIKAEEIESERLRGPDPHRLALEIACTWGSMESSIELWIPGVSSDLRGLDEVPAPLPQALPPHMSTVGVTLGARLGSVEVPLTDLLALEVGDIIPLDSGPEDPLELFVGEKACARARLGVRGTHLAIRIEQLLTPHHPNQAADTRDHQDSTSRSEPS